MNRSPSKYLQEHSRVIIHIDIDCFYAQVEMVRDPSLRDKPMGIKQKNFLVTCNYVARSLGVQKCTRIRDALKILPSLVLIDGSDLAPYRKCSSQVYAILRTYTESVERLGLDENFIDVTDILGNVDDTCEVVGHIYGFEENCVDYRQVCHCGCYKRLVAGSKLADRMRKNIYQVTGLTTCAGVSVNKLLAKMISGHRKPNAQTVLFPAQVEYFMTTLKNAQDIPGIGSATGKILESLGIVSLEDLRSCPLEILNQKFDPDFSLKIKNLSKGIDFSLVRSSGMPQTIGIEDVFKCVTSVDEVKAKIEMLVNRLLGLLYEDGRFPTAIRIAISRNKTDQSLFHRETRQEKLPPHLFGSSDHPLASDEAKSTLVEIALNLFKKIVDATKSFHLTLIGLSFVKFVNRATKSQAISNFFQNQSNSPTNTAAESVPTTKKMKEDWSENSRKDWFNDCSFSDSGEDDFSLPPSKSAAMAYCSVGEADKSDRNSKLNLFSKSGSSLTKIPPGFDPDVWKSLPEDVKCEAITCSQTLGKVSILGGNVASPQVERKTSSRKKGKKKEKKPSGQTTLNSFFKVIPKEAKGKYGVKNAHWASQRDRSTSHLSTHKDPCIPYEMDSSSSSLGAKTSSLLSSSKEETTSDKQRLSNKGINLEVFKELPPDIQAEILSTI